MGIHPKRLRELFEKYDRRVSAVSLIFGLIVESYAFSRIDTFFGLATIGAYFLIAGVSILLLNLHESGRVRWISETAHLALLVFLQYSFGGLYGRFLIYYGRSGSFAASWPFLLLLASILASNEVARRWYSRLALQIGLLYAALLLFFVFSVPIALGRMGDAIFFLSGFLSLCVIGLFVHLLSRLVLLDRARLRVRLASIVLSIFGSINFLYFSNIIPPIPLSLRTAEVYHRVARVGTGYQALQEQTASDSFFTRYPVRHIVPGGSLSVFSAVFAPANFGTSIVHRWESFDPVLEEWTPEATIVFPVSGGRDEGYRGYSSKSHLFPGFWRVVIQTPRGQSLGTVRFKVEVVRDEPALAAELL